MGNAKNAGKTTVLNALVGAFSDVCVGVTSIGLDGEELDAVTYLPKPRIRLTPGTLAATAESCLTTAEAGYRIVGRTGIMTGLGEIVILEITRAGILLIGGPSTVSATERIVGMLRERGAERVFLDGAFARGSHAAAGDAMIYVAGAHLSASMTAVVQATRFALKKFSLPGVPAVLETLSKETEIGWVDTENGFHPLGAVSAVGSADAVLDKIPPEAAWIYLPKALGPTFAKRFVERRDEHQVGIVVNDPFSIVMPDDVLRHLLLTGRDIRVLHPMKVLFVAINPFSPAGHRFDGIRFSEAIRSVTALPVIDVMEE
ncbi:MAG TPA: hypothetical protein DCR44_03060 [Acholeplasmatales bacterium]|nr:MAG: hypothetical protein A2Y16_04780 [Tenericutes bacterium GWF2_57_13]HAQ56371.1 hypothetical protein [Acholeplasmatales bacterium]